MNEGDMLWDGNDNVVVGVAWETDEDRRLA